MDNAITFTPAQLMGVILAVCAGISCVGGAAVWIGKAFKAARRPNRALADRVASLEKRIERYNEMFGNDRQRLDQIERGNRVTQRAILALLTHGINGNDVESLKTAEIELRNFLIEQ